MSAVNDRILELVVTVTDTGREQGFNVQDAVQHLESCQYLGGEPTVLSYVRCRESDVPKLFRACHDYAILTQDAYVYFQ